MEVIYPKIIAFLEKELCQDTSGHSLDHALRVYQNARMILNVEGGNERIILISALVHDVIDPKLFKQVKKQEEKLLLFLKESGCSQEELKSIQYIINNISFKGGGEFGETYEPGGANCSGCRSFRCNWGYRKLEGLLCMAGLKQ